MQMNVYMHTLFIQVVGIDPDIERLQLAMEKYSAPNLTYQEGTAEDITESDFDAVFSNSVLHWCEDKDAVFKQVKRSLKKGGQFGFVTPNNFDIAEQFCTPAYMISEECREYIINKTYLPSTDDLHDMITVNEFQQTYMNEHIRDWRFESVGKLIEFYMTHFNEFGRHHYNVEAMKRHYGDGEIIFKMPYTTVILVK